MAKYADSVKEQHANFPEGVPSVSPLARIKKKKHNTGSNLIFLKW